MQIEKSTIERVKAKLKENYPGIYALQIVQKLRIRRVSVTPQQVYNFFNHIPVSHKVEIINAAFDMLQDAREKQRKAENAHQMAL